MKKSLVFSSVLMLVVISPPLVMRGAKQTAKVPISLIDLAELVNERLSYMKAVAAYKWENQLAIEDLKREQMVIQRSVDQASTFHLDSATTRLFFEEQITAAKRIQQYWFDQWEANGFDADLDFGDLNTETRPALLELGDQILTTISELKVWENAETSRGLGRLDFITSLTIIGLENKEKNRLFKAVTQIKGQQEEEEIFQVSRLDSLMIGKYDGKTTYGALKNYGDFGVGTFNAVDGEMVALDGVFYQVKTDGVAYPVKKNLKTPFAVVTHFEEDLAFDIEQSMTLQELLAFISSKLEGQEGYYAIRVDGKFKYAKTRSVHAQDKPYPPLAEVVAGQEIFELEEVQGTMVGYSLPDEVAGENAVGYHFHFLTADRHAGGHLLDGIIQQGVESYQSISLLD